MGIFVIVIGLAVSIGLHEFGHLIPAKLFGVKVPMWAIGFGPKLFSKKIGETEYSFRLIPLGGFITMIGMYPPDRKGKDSKRRFGRLIAQAREAHSEHMVEGDAGKRTLYSLPAWKRIIIMFGGPFVNLVLGLSLLTGVFVSVGTPQQTTKVGQVIACVDAMTQGECDESSTPTPAVSAGLTAGDEILAVDGKQVTSYAELQSQLADSNQPVDLRVERNGSQLTKTLPAVWADLPYQDPETGKVSTKSVRIIGVSFEVVQVPAGVGESFSRAGDMVTGTFGLIASFPQQVYSTLETTVTGQDRNPEGAVSILGVAQASSQIDSVAYWFYLLGALNIALFAFNMIPLPPLDGGHIAGAVYEYLKRGAFRLVGKKDPGPVDTALMAPIAQVMFFVLLLAGLLMILADVVNPIRF
jgi:membrane-associated protease RseP (regulator of RpoE activity)